MGKIFENFKFKGSATKTYNPENRGLFILGLITTVLDKFELYQVIKIGILFKLGMYPFNSFADFIYTYTMFPKHTTLGRILFNVVWDLDCMAHSAYYKTVEKHYAEKDILRKIDKKICLASNILDDGFYTKVKFEKFKALKDLDNASTEEMMSSLQAFKKEWARILKKEVIYGTK